MFSRRASSLALTHYYLRIFQSEGGHVGKGPILKKKIKNGHIYICMYTLPPLPAPSQTQSHPQMVSLEA